MSAFDDDGISIGNNLPKETGMTFKDYCRMRGYDPETKTYSSDETPDFGAVSRLPKLRPV